MKKCICCGEEKELGEFYKHKQMKDGYLNKCKECSKRHSNDNRKRNEEYYKEYDKRRSKNPGRVAARKEYSKTKEGKIARARANRLYRDRYPMKRAAHIIVSNAIRDGVLERKYDCEICGSSEKIEAHHDNYLYPLSVRWLCEKCHKEWHMKNEAIYKMEEQ